jgi:hypothetical protein
MKNFALLVSLTILLLASVSLTLSSTVSAQQATPIAQQGAAPSPTVSAEVVALRAQTEILREDNERMFSAVAMGIGVIIAIAFLQWAQNRFSYDRDRKAFEHELHALVSEEVSKIGKALEEKYQENVARVATDLEAQAKKAADAATAPLQSELREMKWNVSFAKYEICSLAAQQWEKEEIWSNALRTHADRLNAAREMKSDHFTGWVLDDIRKILNRPKKPRIDTDDLVTLEGALEAVPIKFKTEVSIINERLRAIRRIEHEASTLKENS